MNPENAAIASAVAAAAKAIPPLWPLSATVAVNPFLGQAHEPLAQAVTRLQRAAGIWALPSAAYLAGQLAAGAISTADLDSALHAASPVDRPADVAALIAAVTAATPVGSAIATVAEIAAASGRDWPGVIAERFGHWAAGYLDAGQALWTAPRDRGAWAAWRATATHDLTPEILGLRSFAAFVAASPETPHAAIARAVTTLGVPDAALEAYFHRLLVTLGGWAQAARQLQWLAAQESREDCSLTAFLAIRLMWEEALFVQSGDILKSRWQQALSDYAMPLRPSPATTAAAIVQDAAERAVQRRLADSLAMPAPPPRPIPQIQAAFCIDVRSEVFRRALETADPSVATIGFAGFFGLGAAHRRMASDVVEAHLPVLLTPTFTTRAAANASTDTRFRLAARSARAWDRFKLAAVSSFAFVEAAGPAYIVKLVRDASRIAHATSNEPLPLAEPDLPLETRVATAEAVLRAMSLTRDFAPLILIVGHGAAVVNNPHASALHCGACGGYAGDVNARLLATLLNDAEVRRGLAGRGINLTPETHVVAGLHDTTSDEIMLYTDDARSAAHDPLIAAVRRGFAAAGIAARAERATRLPRGGNGSGLALRSRDWAEVRPEWGLAGCNAFVAAPRLRTVGRDLGGRVFLHDYRWQDDDGFGVLELILTAPVVVASWISLQYYGSAVAPELFGGGNKLLHNVVGGIGVVEGNGGILRAGLPWQSVYDGAALVHDPVRLTVAVEAPREAIAAVLARHDEVRALFDNGWLHLFAMDDAGHIAWRYVGDAIWESASPSQLPAEIASANQHDRATGQATKRVGEGHG